MLPWFVRSRLEVSLHELLHELGNFAEGYREDYVYGAASCPPADDGGWTPGVHKSVMSCGLTNGQFLDGYPDRVWGLSHQPAPVAGVAVPRGGGGSCRWGSRHWGHAPSRRRNGPKSPRAPVRRRRKGWAG